MYNSVLLLPLLPTGGPDRLTSKYADIHSFKLFVYIVLFIMLTVLFLTNQSISTSHANIIIAYKTIESVVPRVENQFIFWRSALTIVTNKTFAQIMWPKSQNL